MTQSRTEANLAHLLRHGDHFTTSTIDRSCGRRALEHHAYRDMRVLVEPQIGADRPVVMRDGSQSRLQFKVRRHHIIGDFHHHRRLQQLSS